MKAIRVHRFGPPAVMALEDLARPIPGEGEVLVKVDAAGVGPWDSLVRSGQSGLGQTLPLTPGSDLSGTVVEIGSGVTTFAAGDIVYGTTNALFTGAYAEFAVAKAAMLASKPFRLTAVEAAGVPVVAVTAWQMLHDLAKLRPDQTVLVTGAAGSVGSYVLQLARLHGNRTIAAISSDDTDRVRRLGADEVIDLRHQSLDLLQGKIDVVIDTAGGNKQSAAARTLRHGGFLASSVNPPDPEYLKHLHVRGQFFIVNVTTTDLDRVARLLNEGQLIAQVGAVLALDEAQLAHEMLAGERPYPRGKIVLDLNRKLARAH